MNKITYLNELETALDALPRHLRDQKMYEYERYFYEQELNGVDEEEILKKLKDPQDVAMKQKLEVLLIMLNLNQHLKIFQELLSLH